jgi:hypothetical protein
VAKNTWKCLKGCRRSFLKLLSKLIGNEEIMNVSLVGEEVGVVRTNWGVLVILDLLKSVSGAFQHFGLPDLQVAERCSDLGRK